MTGMITWRLLDFTFHRCRRRHVNAAVDGDPRCRCCRRGCCVIGPAAALGPLVLILLASADVTYYVADNNGTLECKAGEKGVWGLLPVAHAMGAVNGVSMDVDKATTNAVTGHWLKAASLVFDHLTLGLALPQRQELLSSLAIIVALLGGIAAATLLDKAPFTDMDGHDTFHPFLTILGFVFVVLLWLHDWLGMHSWDHRRGATRPKAGNHRVDRADRADTGEGMARAAAKTFHDDDEENEDGERWQEERAEEERAEEEWRRRRKYSASSVNMAGD